MNDRPEDKTQKYEFNSDKEKDAGEILLYVCSALEEKGYEPVNQIIGYLLSWDPAYITSHKNARDMIRKVDRDELLKVLVKFFVENYNR